MKYIFSATLLAIFVSGCGSDNDNHGYTCESIEDFRKNRAEITQAIKDSKKEEAQSIQQKIANFAMGWPTISKGEQATGLFCQQDTGKRFYDFSQDQKNKWLEIANFLEKKIQEMP